MSQAQETILQMVSQLPLSRQMEVRTFIEFLLTKERSQIVNLAERGINEAEAASLRERLQTFQEDWERPEMDGYDAL